jgi:quercetin dioxygenase-like cupin family protein
MEKRSIHNTPEDPETPTRPSSHGMHVWWLISKLVTGADQITLNVAEFPPGQVHEVHRHPNCEAIVYVLRGRGLHLSDGKPVRLEEGEAVFIEQGEWHGFANDTDQPTTLITVYGGVGSLEEAGYDVLETSEVTA